MSQDANSGAERPGSRWGWFALGALALIAAVFVATRVITRSSSNSGAKSSPHAAQSTHGSSPKLTVAPDPAVEQTPGAHCWNGLLDLDRSGSLQDMRDALARAVASGDDLPAGYLQERIADLIGNDASRAEQILAWASTAHGKELEVLLGALAKSGAVQQPAIAERLLKMGEGADVERRVVALSALETQHRLDAGSIARAKAIAVDPKADDAAWAATRMIGRVMKEDFDRTGSYQPYMDQLMAITKSSADSAVRTLALEMPAYSDPIIGKQYIDDLAAMLTTAPESHIREMAAFQLGLTEDPERVLGIFRAAFPKERAECVRWAIFRFSARAAGPGALPVLEALARMDKRFQVDLTEFKKLYASGVRDFERIWLDKAENHSCTQEDPEKEGADS